MKKVKKDEFEMFLSHKENISVSNPNQNIIQTWINLKPIFPKLYKLVTFWLFIPATTIASESNFSHQKWIMDARAACLKPETVDALLVNRLWKN